MKPLRFNFRQPQTGAISSSRAPRSEAPVPAAASPSRLQKAVRLTLSALVALLLTTGVFDVRALAPVDAQGGYTRPPLLSNPLVNGQQGMILPSTGDLVTLSVHV